MRSHLFYLPLSLFVLFRACSLQLLWHTHSHSEQHHAYAEVMTIQQSDSTLTHLHS